MKIRFQADADLNEGIVSGVVRRVPEVDFQTATQAGLHALQDKQVLEIAARANRVLVSHDWETMPYHFADFISVQSSPGVLIVPQQLGVGRVIEELVMIWVVSEAEEYTNFIRRIPL
jgi:uncharacterized protein DUF5615